tara:strand:+ start:2231 stop:2557 length:327 start_codon:yes stop_codon:yes gene_type:complete
MEDDVGCKSQATRDGYVQCKMNTAQFKAEKQRKTPFEIQEARREAMLNAMNKIEETCGGMNLHEYRDMYGNKQKGNQDKKMEFLKNNCNEKLSKALRKPRVTAEGYRF